MVKLSLLSGRPSGVREATLIGCTRHACPQSRAASLSKPFRAERPGARPIRKNFAVAVSKGDLDELEMQVAILNQEMRTAAEEERFKEAAQFRDRLENLRLKQRCMQVEHREGLRNSICHRIGQLMQHKRYKYRGVIFGVHSCCQASESWIQSMGVDALPHGRHQPFYQVLADERDRVGGMITYVAQENIGLFEGAKDQANPVQHKQIKQMFRGFDVATSRFLPTKELLAMYPDSIEAREQADATESNDKS